MEQYQIGNEVKGIIRAYCPGILGQEEMKYARQPYTMVEGISATVNFKNLDREGNSSTNRVLFHDMSFVDSVTLSNVKLTDKIINLIFPHSIQSFKHLTYNGISDVNSILYIPSNQNKIYNVFIYDSTGNLETAYEEITLDEPLTVNKSQESYLIVYDEAGQYAVDLQKKNNYYLMLDLELIGNIDDSTAHMWMHFDKCGLEVEKNMYFTQNSNAIDLTFKVIDDKFTNNYITLK